MSSSMVRMDNGVTMTREAYDTIGYPPPSPDSISGGALERLAYEAEADSAFVASRGPKAAILAAGRVGFYFADQVGDVVGALVREGHVVTVLPRLV